KVLVSTLAKWSAKDITAGCLAGVSDLDLRGRTGNFRGCRAVLSAELFHLPHNWRGKVGGPRPKRSVGKGRSPVAGGLYCRSTGSHRQGGSLRAAASGRGRWCCYAARARHDSSKGTRASRLY